MSADNATGYRLTSTAPLATGSHTLTIGTGPLDLSDQGLEEIFTQTFTLGASAVTTASPGLTAATAAATTTQSLQLYDRPQPTEVTFPALANPFGYHSRQHDFEAGLIYFRNRYYDPELGRFITADPLGYVDGPSQYGFAGNDPVNFGDPLGLETVILWYGRGSGYGMGEGFDEVTAALIKSAEERGSEYRLVKVVDYQRGHFEELEVSPGFSRKSPDDLKIFVVTNASRSAKYPNATLINELLFGMRADEDIFLSGHSVGAAKARDLAEDLGSFGVRVRGLISIDHLSPFSSRDVPKNVEKFLAYVSRPSEDTKKNRADAGSPHFPGSGASKFSVPEGVKDLGVKGVDETHQSIDSSPEIREAILDFIEASLGRGDSEEDD